MPANITLSPKQFLIALVAVASGGAVGTLIRDLLLKLSFYSKAGWTGTRPPPEDWTHLIPWVLLLINTFGVFLATDLLRRHLRHHDPNDPQRLVLITGFLGGLTSYSGLFVDLGAIWHQTIAGAFLVAVGAIVAGVFAGWLGLGRHRHR
jgi:fluoride ion exporter CrcB/FEX